VTPSADTKTLHIAPGVDIRRSDLRFRFARSSGPGGQNVNKVNTRVTLLFDVVACESFSESQRKTVLGRLASRINADGIMRVVSSRHRTQAANKKATVARFVEILSDTLRRRTPRKKTGIPRGARERRLRNKTETGLKKRLRGRYTPED
jgi:ribosome-associated protein